MNNLIKQIVESKFNFNIDIEDNGISSLHKSMHQNITQAGQYNESFCVDLGLSSGTKWHMYNLGVDPNKLNTAKDWIGNYYAWGEIETKDSFTWDNYKYSIYKDGYGWNVKKYCDDPNFGKNDKLYKLQLCDDAANAIYQNFRMPTMLQMLELINETNNEKVTNYNKIEGLNGRLFTSKVNDNSIFIPVTGWYTNDILSDDCGYYWSSILYKPSLAYMLYFNYNKYEANNIYTSELHRYGGCCIRPVLNKN